MKTAISVPDETFDRVTERVEELGMSRSEFFSRAAEHYLDTLDEESLTARINTALESLNVADQSQSDAIRAGHRLLADMDDEW